MIEATVICDSISEHSPRLVTMFWRYPKFVHQESLRHRKIYFEDQLRGDFDFSFSVSSARAIPFEILLKEVRSDTLRAEPVKWGTEQKGMSPGDELPDENPKTGSIGDVYGLTPREKAITIWRAAAIEAANFSKEMAELGVHKSICNRIIEPYIHVNCLATATEPGWMNFFGLRLDKAADPTLRALAEEAWKVWKESKPQVLQPGDWHLPFVSRDEIDQSNCIACGNPFSDVVIKIKISVARCARLSYLSFETGKRSTTEEDIRLYNRLVGSIPIHASPAEHQATPDIFWDTDKGYLYTTQAANFGPGWRQYRKMLSNEAIAPLPKGY